MADFLSVCRRGDFDAAVRILSLEKINPRTLKDADGLTPLHCACESGNVQLVRILIQKYHCDPESKGLAYLGYGTPLYTACRYENYTACKWVWYRPSFVDLTGRVLVLQATSVFFTLCSQEN